MYHPAAPPAATLSAVSVHHQARLRLPVTSSLPNLRRESSSHPMNSPPGSPVPATCPSPAILQNHIYAAFLERRTADVALHIRGSWHAVYKLHRVVLIQAGFFQSLFTSGFSESKAKLSSHRLGPETIDIVLEDPNITRAAFEVCIAHLYGGGPALYVSSSLIPTTRHPLTPSFPAETSAEDLFASGCPKGQHPASPRFLLSLLATAVFLSITPIASQAMSFILSTVGPYTVSRYLNFALGQGIGEPVPGEPEAAVGLEGVAELIPDDEEEALPDESALETPRGLNDPPELGSPLRSSRRASELDIQKEAPSDLDHDTASSAAPDSSPSFFYGVVSDKIGEACACWLTRWGIDFLDLELQCTGRDPLLPASTTGNRKRSATVPSSFSSDISSSSSSTRLNHLSPRAMQHLPVIWRDGGLPARWIRGVLSSDVLFVSGEKERYDAARRVVELRRSAGTSPQDEYEFELLFCRGIYYANMGLDALMAISTDVSPTTGKPYVPMSVLQSAHWDQSVLRHSIMTRPISSSSPPTSPVATSPSKAGKELGVTVTSAELAALLNPPPGKPLHATVQPGSPYFPVPVDSSLRIGDNVGIEGASLDQLFDVASPSKGQSTGTLATPFSEESFFGIEQQIRPASMCARDPGDKSRWSPYPPFRFSVEFWDVDALKEKSRLHSRTIWYAGSLWNVYVQVVRKKGVQLGVYLHRQSTVDPIPPASAPVTFTPSPSSSQSLSRSSNLSHSSGVPLHQTISSPTIQSPTPSTSRSGTPQSLPSSPAMSSSLPNSYSPAPSSNHSAVSVPATVPPVMPQQPWRDPRAAVSAYFTVACSGATGSSLTRFSSAPDVFSVSQSWGWKSSSLRTGEHSESDADGASHDTVAAGKEVSLRATVVLGVV